MPLSITLPTKTGEVVGMRFGGVDVRDVAEQHARDGRGADVGADVEQHAAGGELADLGDAVERQPPVCRRWLSDPAPPASAGIVQLQSS